VVQDVTDRRLREAEAERARARLVHVMEHLPAGAVLVEGERVFLNRAAEAITGYAREELATLDGWFAALHPDRPDDMRRAYEADRAQGFPGSTTSRSAAATGRSASCATPATRRTRRDLARQRRDEERRNEEQLTEALDSLALSHQRLEEQALELAASAASLETARLAAEAANRRSPTSWPT
jgi:PAS domain S-box-containing protein